MLFGRRQPKPNHINLPAPIATLPFDLQRTGAYPRQKHQMAALMQAGPTTNVADVTWLPQRMAMANRWKTNRESSSVASPVQAVMQSGTFAQQMTLQGHPLPLQQAYRVAGQLTAQQQANMRPGPTMPATPADVLNNMSKAMPQVGSRISPAALSQAVNQQSAIQQAQQQGAAANRMGAVVNALQRGLYGRAFTKGPTYG